MLIGCGLNFADINECLDRNGGCGMLCENREGSYSCVCHVTCQPGFYLDEDRCIGKLSHVFYEPMIV